MEIKKIFRQRKKIIGVVSVILAILGAILLFRDYFIWLWPPLSYDRKQIIKLAENNDVDSILKILHNTHNDESNVDTYWFTKALYGIMQPNSATDDPIYCIKQINKDSTYYRYSISLASAYLQSNIPCNETPNKDIIDFATYLRKKGDKSPLVDLIFYMESTISRTKYGIGDIRNFPFHNNTAYRICIQNPTYYVQAYKEIRKKYENDNFKITYKGAESLNTELNTSVQIDVIYLKLYKMIGLLHGSAALSYRLHDDKEHSTKEMREFIKYFPKGITNEEKNSFRIIYGSVYPWLLDHMLREYRLYPTGFHSNR